MKYSVGEVAHILNMSPSALRFYESENIIHADKSHSGRRYYSQNDLARLIACKKYSSMEIPIKTIAGQFKPGGDSRQIITERLWEKSVEIAAKAQYYQYLSELIEEQARMLERIDSCLGQYSVMIREGCYILTDKADQLMSREKENRQLIREWIQASPATKLCAVKWQDGGERGNEAVLAYSILEKHAARMKLRVKEKGVEYLPPGPCLHTVVCVQDSFFETEQLFSEILAYAESKSMRLNGAATAVLTVVESLEAKHYDGFLDIMVPFSI